MKRDWTFNFNQFLVNTYTNFWSHITFYLLLLFMFRSHGFDIQWCIISIVTLLLGLYVQKYLIKD